MSIENHLVVHIYNQSIKFYSQYTTRTHFRINKRNVNGLIIILANGEYFMNFVCVSYLRSNIK